MDSDCYCFATSTWNASGRASGQRQSTCSPTRSINSAALNAGIRSTTHRSQQNTRFTIHRVAFVAARPTKQQSLDMSCTHTSPNSLVEAPILSTQDFDQWHTLFTDGIELLEMQRPLVPRGEYVDVTQLSALTRVLLDIAKALNSFLVEISTLQPSYWFSPAYKFAQMEGYWITNTLLDLRVEYHQYAWTVSQLNIALRNRKPSSPRPLQETVIQTWLDKVNILRNEILTPLKRSLSESSTTSSRSEWSDWSNGTNGSTPSTNISSLGLDSEDW